MFGVAGLAPRAGVPRVGVAIALALVGVVGALAIVVAPALGSRIYRGWMLSALPMSWTVSRLALGVVYYVVLTPIGLLLRATGYDPLALRSDPTATSNWIKRDRPRDPDRYFRQF